MALFQSPRRQTLPTPFAAAAAHTRPGGRFRRRAGGNPVLSRAQLIAERKEDFARDMTREMGKVLDETRGDVQEAIDMTYFMAGEGRRMFGQTVPSELRNKFAMSVRQPIGVCSVITPWNFPMAIPSWKIIPALVCGNTVVFKPARTDAALGRQLRQGAGGAGLPPGVVNLVTGGSPRSARL